MPVPEYYRSQARQCRGYPAGVLNEAADEIERLRVEIEQLQNVLGLAMHELHGMESDELHRRYWAVMDRSLISTSEKDHG